MVGAMTIREALIRDGIARDAAYAGCVVRDLRDARYASFSPIVSLCMTPYLSLFVHESYRKLEGTDPALASLLSGDAQAIIERSRHSLKLFEDTHRGIGGQIDYFRDEILPAHATYFIEGLPPEIRRFAKDLGLYSYNGKLIASTHGATFHAGIEPGEILSQSREEARSLYEQYGRCK